MSTQEVASSQALAGALDGPSGYVQWAFLQDRLTGDLLWIYLDAPPELSVYVSKGGAPGVWKKLSSVLRYISDEAYFVKSFSVQHGSVDKGPSRVSVLDNLGGGYQSLTVSVESPPTLYIGDGGNSRKAEVTLAEAVSGLGGATDSLTDAPVGAFMPTVPAVPAIDTAPAKDSPGTSMLLLGIAGAATLLILASVAQKD